MSPTIPIILALAAAGWFFVAVRYRGKNPGAAKQGLIGGILSVIMAIVVLVQGVGQLTISAVIVIPLLFATIFQFGMFIALFSRLTRGKISQGAFLAGVLIIIAAILVGVALMFQPFTHKVFNLGFDFVLIALLAFNVWSHVQPRPKAVSPHD